MYVLVPIPAEATTVVQLSGPRRCSTNFLSSANIIPCIDRPPFGFRETRCDVHGVCSTRASALRGAADALLERFAMPNDPRSEVPAERLPPGQYAARDFPVLHVGNVPPFDPKAWRFAITGDVERPQKLDWQQ